MLALGSYARGAATPSSDLELYAVLRDRPQLGYRTWFVDDLHVSFGFARADVLESVWAEPVSWSLRFAVESPGAWVWATPDAIAALGDPPSLARPAGEPELEDFVEWCAKARRTDDALVLRVAARGLGEEAPALLRELNGSPVVRSRADAVRTAAAFAVAPAGWAGDLLVLLGLEPAADARVREAVDRVGRGVLALLREAGSRVGEGQPELNAYLHDGTLERHLGFA